MTDNEIISLLETSPNKAYRQMIDQYGNLVYAVVLNKLKAVSSREDIEDCVSDIFTEVFQNIDKFKSDKGTLKSFICTIAIRTAIDEYRKLSKKCQRAVSITEENQDCFYTEETPSEEAEENYQKHFIWNQIKKLGEPDSIILVQQFFYDKPVKEIARLLSMTCASVQKRSLRARQKLRLILMEYDINY